MQAPSEVALIKFGCTGLGKTIKAAVAEWRNNIDNDLRTVAKGLEFHVV